MDRMISILLGDMIVPVFINFLTMLFLWSVTVRQRSVTKLGKWLNIFLLCNALSSGVMMCLIYAIKGTDPEDVESVFRRIVLIMIYLVPLSVSFSGIMLIKWSLTGDPAKNQKSQFEKG